MTATTTNQTTPFDLLPQQRALTQSEGHDCQALIQMQALIQTLAATADNYGGSCGRL
jgi:hypothetical protein